MILLDETQTLAAVRRSLETHVLPALSDDFARIQVLAAMKAIDDVRDRFERGDPVSRSNSRLESALAELAESSGEQSPELAARIEAVLGAVAPLDDARTRAALLGSSLVDLLADDSQARGDVFALAQKEASLVSMEDNRWMCSEAYESLQ